MPELPEVETYVRELAPELTGRTITAARVFWTRTIAAPVACYVMYRVDSANKEYFEAGYVHPCGLRLECFAI